MRCLAKIISWQWTRGARGELRYTAAMATIERHKPGSFCWVELGTTDQSAAKNFYRSLFGWEAKDYPMGPNETYTIFNLGGRDTGGGYTLRPDMLAEGIPPHWMLYVQVENADATVAKAASAGAKPMPPGAFDVAENGRMAVIQDPTGAMFSIWQPKSHTGIHAAGEPGTLCWADLVTGDVDRAKQFYEGLFGWQMKPGNTIPPVTCTSRTAAISSAGCRQRGSATPKCRHIGCCIFWWKAATPQRPRRGSSARACTWSR